MIQSFTNLGHLLDIMPLTQLFDKASCLSGHCCFQNNPRVMRHGVQDADTSSRPAISLDPGSAAVCVPCRTVDGYVLSIKCQQEDALMAVCCPTQHNGGAHVGCTDALWVHYLLWTACTCFDQTHYSRAHDKQRSCSPPEDQAKDSDNPSRLQPRSCHEK